jgi:hypothetical protein
MKLQFPLPKDARLVFGVWDFSGAWMLVLGAFRTVLGASAAI